MKKALFVLLMLLILVCSYANDPFGDPVILLNSMVVFASVTQNGDLAANGDVLAAFVEDELRGKTAITVHNNQALAPILINTQTNNELVLFKMWDSSADSVIIAHTDEPLYTVPGSTIGIPPYDDQPYNVYADRVSEPIFSHISDVYNQPFLLEIISEDSEADIYYTLDNSYPDLNSLLYTDPIVISQTTYIKAVSYKAGWTQSNPVSALYSFEPTDLENVQVSVSSHEVHVGDTITVQISTSELQESWEVCAYGFVLFYDDDLLDFIDYSISGTLSSGGMIIVNSNNPGFLNTGYININPLVGEGVLVEFTFNTLLGGNTSLELEDFIFNNTYITNIENGSATITGETVQDPYFSPGPGLYYEPVDIEVYSQTENSIIYYTIDGTEPDESSLLYEEPIPVDFDSELTIHARAYKYGWEPSDIIIGHYIVTGTLEPPIIIPNSGEFVDSVYVEITADENALIRYTTDGSMPNENSTLYDSGFLLFNSTTVKAKAYRQDWLTSDLSRADYSIIGTVAQPEFTPPAGLFYQPISVDISSITNDAQIYYTVDGTDPDQNSFLYDEPIFIDFETEVLIKARAFYDDWIPSNISTGSFMVTGVVPNPLVQPEGGVFTNEIFVTVEVDDPDADVYIKVNDLNWELYLGEFTLDSNTILSAKATKENWQDSEILEYEFVFLNPVTEIYYETELGVVHFEWEMPLGWDLDDEMFLGFEIFRGTDPNFIELITEGYLDNLYYTDNVIEPGFYYYQFKAVYGYGESQLSEIIEIEVNNKVNTPFFDPLPGKYSEVIDLEIFTKNLQAEIYYTLDGSIPDETSIQYYQPISLKEDVLVKAIAIKEGWIPSDISEGFYKIDTSEIDENINFNLITGIKRVYPNPFNHQTIIEMSLGNPTHVTLEIFNIRGKKVNILIDDYFEAGVYPVKWNGKNSLDRSVSSGIYFYNLRAGDYNEFGKVLFLK